MADNNKKINKPVVNVVKEKQEVENAKEKAVELAERFPLNPGGVSADVDPVPQPERPAKVYLDGKLNPGGVRNPKN